jgi:hypothetical protein
MAPDTLTLPVPPEWHQAARYAGHKSVNTWVRSVVQDFMVTGPGRFFPILPLVWTRGTFNAIRTRDGDTFKPHEVRGLMVGPFGIYSGCHLVGFRSGGFTLTHIPTSRRLARLKMVRECKRLAEALAPLRMRWHDTDPDQVGGSDSERVNALVKEHEAAAFPIRPVYTAGVGGRPR